MTRWISLGWALGLGALGIAYSQGCFNKASAPPPEATASQPSASDAEPNDLAVDEEEVEDILESTDEFEPFMASKSGMLPAPMTQKELRERRRERRKAARAAKQSDPPSQAPKSTNK